MPSNNTPKETPRFNYMDAAHEPFSWLTDEAQDYPLADFVALTADVSAGIHTCLEIFHSSELVRSENNNVLHGEEVLPAVTSADGENLLRFAMAAARLLRASAEYNLGWVNEHGAKRLQALKDAAGE